MDGDSSNDDDMEQLLPLYSLERKVSADGELLKGQYSSEGLEDSWHGIKFCDCCYFIDPVTNLPRPFEVVYTEICCPFFTTGRVFTLLTDEQHIFGEFGFLGFTYFLVTFLFALVSIPLGIVLAMYLDKKNKFLYDQSYFGCMLAVPLSTMFLLSIPSFTRILALLKVNGRIKFSDCWKSTLLGLLCCWYFCGCTLSQQRQLLLKNKYKKLEIPQQNKDLL
jgi:hypothetical protein